MSGIVLDTHACLWLLAGDSQLGRRSRIAIDNGLRESQVYLSAISIWEFAVLIDRGRLVLDRPLAEFRQEARGLGVVEAPVTGDVAAAATALHSFPRDPADRLIGATAALLGATLVTADPDILSASGHPDRQDARK